MAHRHGRLIVVCGLPGAGKTTSSQELEVAYGGVRMSPDDWMEQLGADLWDAGFRDRVEQLQWTIAQRLLALGQVVIIEWGTWGRAERDRLRAGARALGAAVELRVVDAPFEVRWRRIADRGPAGMSRPFTRDDLRSADALFQRPDARELALFDRPLGPPRGVESRRGESNP